MSIRPFRARHILCSALAATALASFPGCEKPQQGVPVAHDAVCKVENDRKRVTVEGYLTTGVHKLTLCSDTCSMGLLQTKDPSSSKISVGIRPGSGKNQMKPLTADFKSSSLEFTAADGKVLGNLAHVRLTGKALVSASSCQIAGVDLIEAL